ncbi:MAG: hypothetical protein WED07_04080 [Candidatus Freyarchaeum deiterrae]
MHPEQSGSLSFIRANRDAVAFTTLFPSLKIGETLRRKFIDQCIKKFYEKKSILPTYHVRKLIDVFFSNGIESITARAARLLNIPAELPELVTEITGVTPNGNGVFKDLLTKVENELNPIIVKNGKISVLKYSGFLLQGNHKDWSELRKVFDAILHSPNPANTEDIIKLTQNFTDNPKLLIKELHDNKIISLQGLGKETFIWKAGTPPPKNIILALKEIRQEKLEVTALQILQHQTINQTKNSNLFESAAEALELLEKHNVIKKDDDEQYQIDQYSSISLEAALNDVTPLIQLYRCM